MAPVKIKLPTFVKISEDISGSVAGMGLNQGQDCQRIVYKVNEIPMKTETVRSGFPIAFAKNGVAAAMMKGTYHVLAATTPSTKDHPYRVKVIIVDSAVTAKRDVSITR